MSFLFEPVSTAIETLKYIESASKKGPDPARFVTHLPPNPGTWALNTAYKRNHNLWKWRQYKPDLVPRKEKKCLELKITRTEDESLSGQLQSYPRKSTVTNSVSSKPSTAQSASESARYATNRKSSAVHLEGSLDSCGLPMFGMHEEEEDPEAKRIAEMSPEQKLYYRTCAYFGIRPSRHTLKQVDSMEVCLAHIKCQDVEFKAITAGLITNYCVKRLNLAGMYLTENQMAYLVDFLADDNAITDLIIRDNYLEGRVMKRLFDTLRERDIMVYLDISGNNLRDKDIPYLAAYIETSTVLTYLQIARNKFTTKAGEALGRAMAHSSVLQLNISENRLRGDGMASLINGLAKNAQLERLDISWNSIGEDALRSLINLVKNCGNLLTLDLSGTRINGSCLEDFTNTALTKTSTLSWLKLHHNPILTQDITTFVNKISNLPNCPIRRVDFGDCAVVHPECALTIQKLFLERDVDIRAGPMITYSSQSESIDSVIDRHRNDALTLVTQMSMEDREKLTHHFAKVDMEECIESGADINISSFLGRFNEQRETHKDLALRLFSEATACETPVSELVKSLLGELEKPEKGSKNTLCSRFSSTSGETRKNTVLATGS